jgi:competence protein ComEC
LYITPEHRSLLIDIGWPEGIGAKDPDSAQRIIASARRHGLSKLDYVLITHYHVDHVGGMTELLSQFPVGTVLDHGPNRESPRPNASPAFAAFQPAALYPKYLEAIHGHRHRTLKAGETLSIGSLRLTVVTSDGAAIDRAVPGGGKTIAECDSMNPKDENGGEENARSLGLILTLGRSRIASFGDLTWNIEKALVCRPCLAAGRRDEAGRFYGDQRSHRLHGNLRTGAVNAATRVSPNVQRALARELADRDRGMVEIGGEVTPSSGVEDLLFHLRLSSLRRMSFHR